MIYAWIYVTMTRARSRASSLESKLIGRSPPSVMGIGGQQVDISLSSRMAGNLGNLAPEAARQTAGGQLVWHARSIRRQIYRASLE